MANGHQRIAGRLVGCAVAALFVIANVVTALSAQHDAFVGQRDTEAAKNGSRGFSISLADGRREFHPGEPITLVFTFDRFDVSPFNYEHCQGLGMADAVLDHTDGTADPQADYWNNGVLSPVCGLLSGVVGGIVGPDGRMVVHPIQFPVYLNQAVRFDGPGKYRLYVRSRHRFLGQQGGQFLPPLISNIVEFEILPRDPAWETRALMRAVEVLNSSKDVVARDNAARSLSYLGTPGAIDEMAARFLRNRTRWGEPDDPDFSLTPHWRRGLYGSREREQVVERMERELDRADQYISPGYVSDLAVLNLTRRSTVRPIDRAAYEAQVRAYSIRHLAVLKAASRLQQDIHETLASAAEHSLSIGSDALSSGFPEFPDDFEAAFGSLKPHEQRILLTGRWRNWTVLRDPAFLPMLRRVVNGTDREGPQAIALRLLYDLSPLEGRRLALRELGNRDSVIDIDGLSMLPDRQLPQFERTFLESLESAHTPEDYTKAMDRIERFASARIVTRVRLAYERFKGARGCALAPAALAYFFRVAPGYARQEIANVMSEVYAGDRCEAGVLPAIASRRVVPALETMALVHLSDPNGWIVADAADMLKEYGSARAEAALWRALERWHDRWRGRTDKLERDHRSRSIPWDEAVEDHLTRAIMGGTAWLVRDESQSRFASLCLTQSCKRSIEQEFDQPDTDPRVYIHPPGLPLAEPTFFVHGHTYVPFFSRRAAHQWILMHPTGTTFAWQGSGSFGVDDVWLPGEEPRFFEETLSLVESRGMNLIRRRW